MKLITNYKKIDKREILDCRIKSIKEFIANFQVYLTSYEILLISGAMTFNYDCIKVPGIINEQIPYVTVSHNNVEDIFFESLNIEVIKEMIGTSEKEWLRMQQLIDKDLPILFKIDSRFLSPDEVSPIKYKKLNLFYLSTLLLVGYDLERDKALVVLTNTDDRETVTQMPMNVFQKNRKTVCLPYSPNGSCMFIDQHKKLNISAEMIQEAVIKGILLTAETMLDSYVYQADLGGFEGSGSTRGIAGMKHLIADLIHLGQDYEKQDENNKLFTHLKLIFIRNNMMFGSYSAFREEFGKSLCYCAQNYQLDELQTIGKTFQSVADLWKQLFSIFSAMIHRKCSYIRGIAETVTLFQQIIEVEEQQYKKIIYIIK